MRIKDSTYYEVLTYPIYPPYDIYMRIQKQTLIDALVDCFGYSSNEFDGVDKSTILQYITDDQKEIVKSYLNLRGR